MPLINLHRHVLRKLKANEGKRTFAKIARESGVPLTTMRKIRSGQIADPRVSNLQKLADYFAAQTGPQR